MVEVNLDNKWVDLAIRAISTGIGFAAAGLVGGMFNPVIAQQTGATKVAYQAGLFGLETVTVYKVATTMNDELREDVENYNVFAAEMNAGHKLLNGEKEVNNA